VKIRAKITTGARLVAAFVVVTSSLLGAYAGLLPEQASAAASASGAIVAPTQKLQGPSHDNSMYKCTATLSGPSVDHNVPVDSELADPDGLRSDAATTMGDARSGKGMIVITFAGVNNNSTNNSLCSGAMKLYRDASTPNATTFYGRWNKGHLPADPNGNYVLVTATVNTSAKDVSFTLNSNFTPSGSFDLQLADPSKLLSNATYFPGSGGGGSTSSGNCFEGATTSDALKKCIAAVGPADFTNAGEIVYAGDTYTATGWGNVSNKIVYKLSKAADASRTTGGTPQIVMDTTQKSLDINMDNKGELSQIQSIADALKNAEGASSTVKLELDNVDIGGDLVKGTITALPAGMATFATYYSQDDAVTLVFPTAGTNETPYFGTYARVAGTNKFTLAGSNWGGKCSNLATFSFDSDPKTAATTSYQGSTLTTVSIISADWQLNANDGPCTVGHVPVKVTLNTTASAPDTTASTNTTGDSPTINCSVTLFNPLSWLFCPLASALELVVTSLDNEINNFMDIKPGKGTYSVTADCGNDQWCSYYQSWVVVRNISLGLIAVFALVAVVSQAFGLEIFDAYTIRKVLPRLLIAAIGITLSWPLMMFFINFTNDLGFGIRQLIYAPFSGGTHNLKVQLGGGAQFISSFFIAGGAIMLLGFAGLLSFVATAALAVSVAFLVLILRQMVIALLVIFAPIALACYVLPGTQKVWKLWWDSFSRGLLMFPIIAGMIAIGRVFAAVNSHGAGSINQIIAFVAYFAPYFMIPFTFKLAGGAIATLGGMVNDRSRGAFDRLSKFRKGQTDKRMEHYGDKFGARALQAKASAVRGLNARASNADTGRFASGAMRFAGRRIEGINNTEAQMSALNARRGKQLGDQIATGVDSEIRGLTVDRGAADALYNRGNESLKKRNTTTGAMQYKSLGGTWIDESDVLNGQRRWGKDVSAQQAAVSYEMRKAMEEDDVAGVSKRYASLARNQFGMTDTQAAGAWMGAAFENQNQHLEYKSTNWENGRLNAEKFSKEVYEKKGTYPLSQMSSHTITQLKSAYDTGDAETKQRVQSIAESFVQRGGGGAGGVASVDPDTGAPIPAAPTTPGAAPVPGYVQTNSQGSAHVAENVRGLASHVGVYIPSPGGPATPPSLQNSGDTLNNPPQR
jgi:hypothetical protein